MSNHGNMRPKKSAPERKAHTKTMREKRDADIMHVRTDFPSGARLAR